MKYQTPESYLIELREILKKEHQKLVENKNFIVKSQKLDIANTYRKIEIKLQTFIEDLNNLK